MNVLGTSFFGSVGLGSGLSVRIAPLESTTAAPGLDTGLSLDQLARHVVDMRGALGDLQSASKVRGPRLANSALQINSGPMGLNPLATQTSLTSTAEVNATPTSYTPFSSSFSGTGTSIATLGGVYDGDEGTDTLTFQVKQKSGVVGVDEIHIKITDGNGNKIDEAIFGPGEPPGTVWTLRNGLELSLSAGVTVFQDTFQVQVFDSIGSAVDPTNAFDGTGNAIPNFESGVKVGAGSFTINGAQIDVLASDSINTVLSKITSSSADVQAFFDTDTETVVLLDKSRGSGGTVTLGTDSSGFLDAVKLSGATAVQGLDNDLEQPLDQVSQFKGVTSGKFSINGITFAIDVQVDSMQDVFDRINGSTKSGALAYYDPDLDRIDVVARELGTKIVLDDGSSNLFSALGIATGTHAQFGSSGPRFANTSKVEQKLRELAEAIEPLFDSLFSSSAKAQGDLAAKKLEVAVMEVFDDVLEVEGSKRLRSGFGLDFIFDDPNGNVVQIDADQLSRALERRPAEVIEFLLADSGDGGPNGLLQALDEAFGEISESLLARLGPEAGSGLAVNLTA